MFNVGRIFVSRMLEAELDAERRNHEVETIEMQNKIDKLDQLEKVSYVIKYFC